MDTSDLKKKLLSLWRDIFNASDDKFSLILNNYLDRGMTEVEEVDGEIVAAIMGIPYDFGNNDNNIKALHLVGLATKHQFRSRGIMTRLLAKINDRARREGFVFTFILPTDEGLRKYLKDRDYVNGFYRVIDNYTSLHDFDNEYESILLEQKEKVADLKRNLFRTLKVGVYDMADADAPQVRESIRTLIHNIESNQQDLQIIHSDHDIDVALEHNMIQGGQIYYVCNSSGISAAAFCTFVDECVCVQKLFASDLASKCKVLSLIKKSNPTRGIRHFIPSIEMDRAALWMRTYGSLMKDTPQNGTVSITERVYSLAAHAKVCGMVKILDFAEILKFQAGCRHDLKYSILVKGECPGEIEQISTRDGVVKIKTISTEGTPNLHTLVMTKRDIGEILFRRRDTDNIITEAFGIPSINGAVSLLLD